MLRLVEDAIIDFDLSDFSSNILKNLFVSVSYCQNTKLSQYKTDSHNGLIAAHLYSEACLKSTNR